MQAYAMCDDPQQFWKDLVDIFHQVSEACSTASYICMDSSAHCMIFFAPKYLVRPNEGIRSQLL